jgi:hypothetical protein
MSYTHLNLAEKSYLKRHAYKSYIVNEMHKKAVNETKRRFGFNGHNDRSDAFRHCYWAALIARKYGYHESLKFTVRHEMGPRNPIAEKNMDIYNNKVGAQIGRDGFAESDISQRCFEALNKGELKFLW